MCVSGTSVIQVTATDADDGMYGNSAKLVYSISQGHPYFSVDPNTGTSQNHPSRTTPYCPAGLPSNRQSPQKSDACPPVDDAAGWQSWKSHFTIRARKHGLWYVNRTRRGFLWFPDRTINHNMETWWQSEKTFSLSWNIWLADVCVGGKTDVLTPGI